MWSCFTAELGDYNPHKHFAHYTDSLCLTESTLSAELEQHIIKLHKSKFRWVQKTTATYKYLHSVIIGYMKTWPATGPPANAFYNYFWCYRGLRASQSEIKYLDLVSKQSIYGVQLYNVKVRRSQRPVKPIRPAFNETYFLWCQCSTGCSVIIRVYRITRITSWV